jgi:hypothetical protein
MHGPKCKNNTAEYLNKNYEETFINIVEGQERNHPQMSSTIKRAALVVQKLNQTN